MDKLPNFIIYNFDGQIFNNTGSPKEYITNFSFTNLKYVMILRIRIPCDEQNLVMILRI